MSPGFFWICLSKVTMLVVPLVEIYHTFCWRIFWERIPFETILVSQTFYSPRICLLDAKGQEFPKKICSQMMDFSWWWIQWYKMKNITQQKHIQVARLLKIDHPKILGCPGQGLLGWMVVISPTYKGEDPSHPQKLWPRTPKIKSPSTIFHHQVVTSTSSVSRRCFVQKAPFRWNTGMSHQYLQDGPRHTLYMEIWGSLFSWPCYNGSLVDQSHPAEVASV